MDDSVAIRTELAAIAARLGDPTISPSLRAELGHRQYELGFELASTRDQEDASIVRGRAGRGKLG